MDVIEVEILEDGSLKCSTDKISAPNHSSADMFFRLLRGLCGGKQESKQKLGKVHSHNGITHSH